MISSLLYLIASRLNIQFSVGICARYQSTPKESHAEMVKRIFRYLVDTIELRIWYLKEGNKYLVAYSNLDHRGYKPDRKSTNGQCQFLGGSLVSWFNKKQTTISLSSTKAEYIAASGCCPQVLWLKQQLLDLGIHLKEIPILCDNTSTISLAKHPVHRSRIKHTRVWKCNTRVRYLSVV